MKDLFMLIDGNSLVNRAYFALPPLNTSDGRPSNAVYGFCTMLVKAITDYKPTRLAVAFDLPAPTFRHAEYPQYKATRKGMPDDLAAQLPMLKTILNDMGVKIAEVAGYEADDIIGTLSACTCQTLIITGDRDAFQLIDGCTQVAYTKRGLSNIALYESQAFISEYCFAPAALIDYKALAGDASDNIPGVDGIGEKTAASLVCAYGSLNGVYENLGQIKGVLREKLEAGRESAYLSRRLATIDRAVPLDFSAEDCAFKMPFPPVVRERFIEYGFGSLARRDELFSAGTATPPPQAEAGIQHITASALSGINLARTFAIILGETIQLAPDTDNQSGKGQPDKQADNQTHIQRDKIQSDKQSDRTRSDKGDAVQYDIKVSADLLGAGLNINAVLDYLKPLLEDENILKIVLDAKALKKKLKDFGISLNNFFDVKLAQYLIDVNSRFENESDLCAALGYPEDGAACALLQAYHTQAETLKQLNIEKLYYELELPLVDVLFRMEQAGFKLDIRLNAQLSKEFTARTEEISQEIFTACGQTFNLNSPKQLGAILFDTLKIPYPQKKAKSYSTSADILELLKDDNPVIRKILDYRRITKLNSTYIEGFKKLADKNGIVHTEFKQALTSTGRLSSAEPNLQNIPIREEEGKKLRALFIAGPGNSLVTADYSQIELRLLAHFSRDSVMCAAFNNGEDIHAQTAAQVYGVAPDLVSAEMRQSAKAVNFGIIYGISDYGLANNLRISVPQARQLIEMYFKRFQGIREYLDASVQSAAQKGYAETLFGRIRKIPELKSQNVQIRKFGERVAMNMPLQGSAADVIKAAMIKADKELTARDWIEKDLSEDILIKSLAERNLTGMNLAETGARLILQVHDELIVEAPDRSVTQVRTILKECMENIVKLAVPLEVSVSSGKRWIDC